MTEIGSGKTARSRACLKEHRQHEKGGEGYTYIHNHFRRIWPKIRAYAGSWVFLCKLGNKIEGVIGTPQYLIPIHRYLLSQEIPNMFYLIREVPV